jgi:hypothetical protein
MVVLGVFAGPLAAGQTSGQAFRPQRGQTVAVLPFRYGVGKGFGGLEMDTDPSEAVALVREQVVANFIRGPWRVLEVERVDAVLASKGWDDPRTLPKADSRALGEALGADILCFGEVTRWGRHYLLIHSQVEVGASIRLVDARTGRVLWSRSAKKVRTAGLTKIPTGIGSAAASPIMGLQKAFLYEITNDLAREMASELVAPPAQASLPRMLAAAAQAGEEGLVSAGDRITVVALGDPGLKATFSIGSLRRDLPMTEFGLGRYVGTYQVLPGERFDRSSITVHLFNQAGGQATTTLRYPLVTSRP